MIWPGWVSPIETVVAGFFIGIMIGLTGMGGGSLMTPVMIFIFKVQPIFAVGTDLALSSITKIAGSFVHLRLKNVDFKVTGSLLSGSIPGAVVGLLLLRLISFLQISSVNLFINRFLGMVLIFVSVGLFYPSLWRFAHKIKFSMDEGRKKAIVRTLSFIVGFAVSITSVGSGSIFLPFLLAVYPLSISQVVGIDVFHGAVLTAVAAVGHMVNSSVDFHLLVDLLIGSVPGVVLGSKLSVSFPKRVMELILGSMLAFSGIKLL
jgi:uncharacterized membrane protein YfcA